MATEVTLPQLGESVTEGTITAWLVEEGARVEADQPLFELSSDKIDTEVPAPASGILQEIRVGVDETVDVGTVVAVIGESDDAGGGADAEGDGGGATATTAVEEAAGDGGRDAGQEAAPEPEPSTGDGQEREAAPAPEPTGDEAGRASERAGGNGEAPGPETLASPLVRRLIAEHGLDPSSLQGTGEGGRITREDVEAAAGSGGGAQTRAPSDAQVPAGKEQERKPGAATPQPQRRPTVHGGDRTRLEDLSRIRQRIAAKMMESMSSSAQLTTVQEADVTRVMRLRGRLKDEFARREGVSLSPFAVLARAAVLAIRNHPTVNALADWEAAKVEYRDYVNLGIAVDTPKGLMVPNIKSADELTVAGLARGIKDAADKARGDKKLEMTDLEGGTFTVTNTGSRGVLLDTPILNYPEVAILATGAIQKRPVVVTVDGEDTIAVRSMVYLCLTYDHRILDGADAARYVTEVKEIVETHDWEGEIGY